MAKLKQESKLIALFPLRSGSTASRSFIWLALLSSLLAACEMPGMGSRNRGSVTGESSPQDGRAQVEAARAAARANVREATGLDPEERAAREDEQRAFENALRQMEIEGRLGIDADNAAANRARAEAQATDLRGQPQANLDLELARQDGQVKQAQIRADGDLARTLAQGKAQVDAAKASRPGIVETMGAPVVQGGFGLTGDILQGNAQRDGLLAQAAAMEKQAEMNAWVNLGQQGRQEQRAAYNELVQHARAVDRVIAEQEAMKSQFNDLGRAGPITNPNMDPNVMSMARSMGAEFDRDANGNLVVTKPLSPTALAAGNARIDQSLANNRTVRQSLEDQITGSPFHRTLSPGVPTTTQPQLDNFDFSDEATCAGSGPQISSVGPCAEIELSFQAFTQVNKMISGPAGEEETYLNEVIEGINETREQIEEIEAKSDPTEADNTNLANLRNHLTALNETKSQIIEQIKETLEARRGPLNGASLNPNLTTLDKNVIQLVLGDINLLLQSLEGEINGGLSGFGNTSFKNYAPEAKTGQEIVAQLGLDVVRQAPENASSDRSRRRDMRQ